MFKRHRFTQTFPPFHILLLPALLFAAATAQANEMRVRTRESDLIVIATTKSVEGGYAASCKASRALHVSRVVLHVVRYIKGSGPADIAIPVQSGLTYREGEFTAHQQCFEVTLGRACLWYLQKPGSNGRFAMEREVAPPNRGWWEAPGFDYAPLSIYGQLATQMQLASTEFDSSLPPLVGICDLLAHNAAARSANERLYLRMLAELTYDEQYIGWETPSWGDDKAAAKKWFADKYPKIYVPKNEVEQLRDYALRMAWGQPQYEDDFISLYFTVPDAMSKVDMAMLRKAENMITMADKTPPGMAREWFVTLRQAPKSYRRRILDIAIRRIGEDHMQDAGILECIAGLYDKPELLPNDPKNDYKVPDDLSAKLDAVRALAKAGPGGL